MSGAVFKKLMADIRKGGIYPYSSKLIQSCGHSLTPSGSAAPACRRNSLQSLKNHYCPAKELSREYTRKTRIKNFFDSRSFVLIRGQLFLAHALQDDEFWVVLCTGEPCRNNGIAYSHRDS
jgi:hypothetical protein